MQYALHLPPIPLGLISVILLAIHMVGIAAAAHALMHTRTSQGAVAWVFGLVLLPYFTLLPYLFLGRKHFYGYVELRHSRASHKHVRTQAASTKTSHQTDQPPPAAGAQRFAALTNMLGNDFHGGHRLTLLIDGEAAFAAMLTAIAAAEHYVLVQFFIIHDDHIGRRLQAVLLACAARGVRVCVLYDGIGSHGLPRSYVDKLRAGSVEIHPFATRRWRNRLQLNFRNHRKIVVIDGWRGFVGGLNVGDEYLGSKPPLSPWRDTHMELQGPAVDDLQLAFDENWQWLRGERLTLLPPRSIEGTATSLIAATGPADAQESCSLFFVALIHAARQRVWITTPYLVPDPAVFAALQLAVFRGVDVRILLPSRPDHRTVFMATTLCAHEAVRAGIRVFRYLPGFTHQKVMLIDDDSSVVGSMNLDNRSLRLNFEVAALNIDRDFAQKVDDMLKNDFSNALEIGKDEYQRLPYLYKVAMHVATLFAPVL